MQKNENRDKVKSSCNCKGFIHQGDLCVTDIFIFYFVVIFDQLGQKPYVFCVWNCANKTNLHSADFVSTVLFSNEHADICEEETPERRTQLCVFVYVLPYRRTLQQQKTLKCKKVKVVHIYLLCTLYAVFCVLCVLGFYQRNHVIHAALSCWTVYPHLSFLPSVFASRLFVKKTVKNSRVLSVRCAHQQVFIAYGLGFKQMTVSFQVVYCTSVGMISKQGSCNGNNEMCLYCKLCNTPSVRSSSSSAQRLGLQ